MDEDNQYKRMDRWLRASIWFCVTGLALFTVDTMVLDGSIISVVFG